MRYGLLALFLLTFAPAAVETLDGRRAVIIDGDTVAFGRERVRIMNIDAPETRGARCERELILGLRAKERLAMLLRVGPIEIERHGVNAYGRTLALLDVHGLDVGQMLIREGLALPWQRGKEARDERVRYWCAESG